MHTQSTSGASIADSEMNSTLNLDSRQMAGETYSTAQCGSIVVRMRTESILAILALAGFIYAIGLRQPREHMKLDQPHLSENVACSL